jgi:cell division septation protein DedD
LQIVLFGQPELDAHLHLTSMRQLRERITNSFKVPPLAPANVPDYLKFRVRAAGYHGPDLFDQSATKLLSTVSEGIIRRISILADKSLLAAFADNANTVSAKHVKVAIQDSEFPRFPRKWLVRQATFATVALLVVATLGWNLHQSPGFASIPTTAATKRVLAKAPAAMPAKSVAVANPVSVPSPVATPAPVKTISAVTAAAPKPEKVEQRLLDSTNWLHQQPADRYSLQVAMIATDNQDQLTSTLRKMESEMGLQNVYIYAARKSNPSSSSDLPHFGILVGSYANRADAIKMLDQLATQWGYKAQLRTIGGINKEIDGI